MKKWIVITTIIVIVLIVAATSYLIYRNWPKGNTNQDNGQVDEESTEEPTPIDRTTKIPATATKITPQTDNYPPKLHSSRWQAPVPLSTTINTAGAEDSPYITPDGNTLYFFFTPNPNVPPEQQLTDEVTGIYVARKVDGHWLTAERVMLQDKDKLALDGCEFVQGNIMWFCSAREGYDGINWFTADYSNDLQRWSNWTYYAFEASLEVGELHIQGDQLFYHSARTGGEGGLDIWVAEKLGTSWQSPQNLSVVNTTSDEGWPFVTSDGKELWFTRTYKGSPAIFRSKNVNGKWQTPELIISQFAGEPSLDEAGNLYFVHHFYKNNVMLEADIYVAYAK